MGRRYDGVVVEVNGWMSTVSITDASFFLTYEKTNAKLEWMNANWQKSKHEIDLCLFLRPVTLDRSRSIAFIREPWKYLTRVCWRLSKPSNSRSGSALKQTLNSFQLNQIDFGGSCQKQYTCVYRSFLARTPRLFSLSKIAFFN